MSQGRKPSTTTDFKQEPILCAVGICSLLRRALKRLFFIGEIPMNELAVPKQFQDMIFLQGQSARTNSLLVAERFGKRHDNVLQAIEIMECSDAFRSQNITESQYVDERGKTQKIYDLTWKGFSILAMGFTGKAAMEWKERFLDAFEWMQNELAILQREAALKQGRVEGRNEVRQDSWDQIGREQRDAIGKVAKSNHRWEQERGRKEQVQKDNKVLTKANEKLNKENIKLRAELKAAKSK